MRTFFQESIAVFCALALGAVAAPPVSMADLLAVSPASDWRPLDPEYTMIMDLPTGRVVIELAPAYAPAAVAAIKGLVSQQWFDAAFILRSQDNYVVQWSRDEDDPKARAMSHRKLAAEFYRAIDDKLEFVKLDFPDTYAPEVGFSGGFPVARDPARKQTWLTHCYGSVGVGRDTAPDTGNGAELYAVIGQSPRNLDRNVTLVGRVVEGIELLSVVPRGPAPMGFYAKREQWIPLKRVRMASDLPAGERIAYETLKSGSATFTALVQSRATRKEEWFQDSVGRIGICNVPLPVRVKAR
jgi:peptidylprolyl isomerase